MLLGVHATAATKVVLHALLLRCREQCQVYIQQLLLSAEDMSFVSRIFADFMRARGKQRQQQPKQKQQQQPDCGISPEDLLLCTYTLPCSTGLSSVCAAVATTEASILAAAGRSINISNSSTRSSSSSCSSYSSLRLHAICAVTERKRQAAALDVCLSLTGALPTSPSAEELVPVHVSSHPARDLANCC